ncbi:hypothetical protein AMECASPLE_033580 [Ameca splendens]|uniref:Uncharacterized protein n=1 Tax=Ameca splendens TaxID=208324 RepID=A0ABV1A3V7_9TELE
MMQPVWDVSWYGLSLVSLVFPGGYAGVPLSKYFRSCFDLWPDSLFHLIHSLIHLYVYSHLIGPSVLLSSCSKFGPDLHSLTEKNVGMALKRASTQDDLSSPEPVLKCLGSLSSWNTQLATFQPSSC